MIDDVYLKMKSVKKPKSGVPCDLPFQRVKEFAPELANPVQNIINGIIESGQWPTYWKQEWVTPIGKVPMPETEDDLRPISVTNFGASVRRSSGRRSGGRLLAMT